MKPWGKPRGFFFGESTMAENSISVVKTGATRAFTATSASVAIPTDSSGELPKYIRLNATAACCVKIGPSGVAATTADLMLSAFESEVIAVGRQAYIAAIQVSAAGTLQISPLEDQ